MESLDGLCVCVEGLVAEDLSGGCWAPINRDAAARHLSTVRDKHHSVRLLRTWVFALARAFTSVITKSRSHEIYVYLNHPRYI